jgi:5-methylcytosine-specific restriction endonuclease McrA
VTVPNVICEARVDGVCQGRAQHMHHVVLRSRGGSNDLSNLRAVCTACHDHIHANPRWATEHGFMASRWAS